MQPRQLTLRNFGPFIHETIDFSEFEEGGLFLISGKTGAGKTTIFDSMTYALFGETTGQQRSGKEMRSLFASPDEMTSVTFLFEHQNMFYQVERAPEQTLRKKRGEGTTSQASKVSLTIYDVAMKELKQLTKRGEVDTFIQDLLQLDAKQFFQIILLPQGEFRNFLIASSAEKEKLLRNVFGTALYQRLTDWLHEEQRQKAQELEKQKQQILTLGEQFLWTGERKTALTIPETFTVWEQDMSLLAAAIEQTTDEHLRLQTNKQTAEQEFYAAKTLHAQKSAHEERVAAFEKLQQQAPIIQAQKERLTFLQQLEKDQSLLQQVAQSRLLYQEKTQALANLTIEYDALVAEKAQWENQQATIQAHKQALNEQTIERDHYERLLPMAQEMVLYQEQFETVQHQCSKNQAQLDLIEKRLQEIVEEISAVTLVLKEKEALSALEVALVKMKGQVDLWEEKRQALNQVDHALEQKNQQMSEVQAELALATDRVTVKEALFKQRQSEYAQSQITYWRSKLLPGEACLICGSLEHPALNSEADSHLTQDTITEEEVQEAQQAWEQARNQMLTINQQVEQRLFEQGILRTQQETLQEDIQRIERAFVVEFAVEEALSPKAGYEQAQGIFNEKKDRYTQALEQMDVLEKKQQSYVTEKAELLEKMSMLDKQTIQLQTELDHLAKQLGSFSLFELQTMIGERTQRIDSLQGTIQDYERAGERLANQQLVLSERKDVWCEQLKECEEQLHHHEAQIASCLEAYGPLMTEDHLRSRLVELADISPLVKEVTDYEEQWKILHHRITEEAALTTLAWPELTVLEAAYEQVKEQETLAYKALLERRNQQTRNQALIEQLHVLWQKNQDALEELGELQHLSATLRGDNPEKLSLERYLLQSFLQEVLMVANQRLVKLTRGRYQFLLAEEKGSYRNSTGLEINIYDDNAGTTRRSQTLSGGESFIAALALALSLADVIQQQSGGVSIEALFIDEGFGSLDEESLEMALEALEMIEQEGRLIGIISHVRELKDRIVQQLIVETNGAGQSQTRTKIG